ncbi:MAG: hypothetical protein O7H41_10205 [Planctomycetota bacterium]|nr:hypothetical protein [Planctomycetota bacterium]
MTNRRPERAVPIRIETWRRRTTAVFILLATSILLFPYSVTPVEGLCVTLPQEGDDGWDRTKQGDQVKGWEGQHKQAEALLGDEDLQQVRLGIGQFEELEKALDSGRVKITNPALKEILARLEARIEETRSLARRRLVEVYPGIAEEIQVSLRKAAEGRNIDEFLRIYMDELVPLADRAVAEDPAQGASARKILEDAGGILKKMDAPRPDRQGELVGKLEAIWRKARRLVDMGDPEKISTGLSEYESLVALVKVLGPVVDHADAKRRLDAIRGEMMQKKRIFKIKILERYIKEARNILARMEMTKRKKKYSAAIAMYENELRPLRDRMIAMDNDFTDVADEILAKGQALHEEATIGARIEEMRLEVIEIRMPDDGSGNRFAVIVNHSEKPDVDPPPEDWKPAPREYRVGDAIQHVDGLEIIRLEKNLVVCLYLKRYEIDLDLSKAKKEK